MSAARIVFGVFWAVSVATTACSDGGPPGGWNRTSSHHAPDTAADGGRPSSRADAADGDDKTDAASAGDASDDAGEDARPDSPMFAPDIPATRVKPPALTALCDGSPGITFSALTIGGGPPQPGTQVMAENGYNFLIIEGTCRYWAMSRLLAHVTTGTLSEAEEQAVVDAFHLDQWPLNTGSYTGAIAADGPSYYMLFGRELNALDCTNKPAADGCDKLSSPGKFGEFTTLRSNYSSKLDQLSSDGKAYTGDVRYVLITDADSWISDWQKPSSWPLGDPASVAMTQEQAANYKPGQSQLARGADALALQDIWRKFLEGEISGHGPYNSLGIPVEVAGKRYALYLRDSIPLENDRGLILF